MTKWVLTAGGCLFLPGVVLSGLAVLISSSTGYDRAGEGWIVAGFLAFVGGLWLLRRIIRQGSVPVERPRWSDDREPPPPPQLVRPEPPAPAGRNRHGVVLALGCLVAIVLLFASFPVVIYLADTSVRTSHQSLAPGALEPTPLPTPDAVQFGTGGAGCTLATTATTFSTRDRIRLVGAGLPAGELLTIQLLQDGKLYAAGDRPTDPTSGCVDDDLPSLPVGHYEVRIYEVGGATEAAGPVAPPLALGEFDVTP